MYGTNNIKFTVDYHSFNVTKKIARRILKLKANLEWRHHSMETETRMIMFSLWRPKIKQLCPFIGPQVKTPV